MDVVCQVCDGRGFRIIERTDGSRAARECECKVERRRQRTIAEARIPRLYENSTLGNFEPRNEYLINALYTAEQFVLSYPVNTRGVGFLITGQPGRGKTHLAIGILKALINERGAKGVFCHFLELVKEIQNSFNRNVQTTEFDVLRPIFEAEVLVLDELGAAKPSAWVFDTIAHIINTRYNERRTTIVTTNYANREALLTRGTPLSAFEEAREAMRNESLGDRIGDRMLSRLQEMCMVLEVSGEDLRTTSKRARFG